MATDCLPKVIIGAKGLVGAVVTRLVGVTLLTTVSNLAAKVVENGQSYWLLRHHTAQTRSGVLKQPELTDGLKTRLANSAAL